MLVTFLIVDVRGTSEEEDDARAQEEGRRKTNKVTQFTRHHHVTDSPFLFSLLPPTLLAQKYKQLMKE